MANREARELALAHAMSLAIEAPTKEMPSPEAIVAAAQVFEEYLDGGVGSKTKK